MHGSERPEELGDSPQEAQRRNACLALALTADYAASVQAFAIDAMPSARPHQDIATVEETARATAATTVAVSTNEERRLAKALAEVRSSAQSWTREHEACRYRER